MGAEQWATFLIGAIETAAPIQRQGPAECHLHSAKKKGSLP
jgi:hypothetical protein